MTLADGGDQAPLFAANAFSALSGEGAARRSSRQPLAITRGNLWIKRAFEITTVAIGLKLLVG